MAWRDFGLELQPGVLGLLGPNGAGKTTLMNGYARGALRDISVAVLLGAVAAPESFQPCGWREY